MNWFQIVVGGLLILSGIFGLYGEESSGFGAFSKEAYTEWAILVLGIILLLVGIF